MIDYLSYCSLPVSSPSTRHLHIPNGHSLDFFLSLFFAPFCIKSSKCCLWNDQGIFSSFTLALFSFTVCWLSPWLLQWLKLDDDEIRCVWAGIGHMDKNVATIHYNLETSYYWVLFVSLHNHYNFYLIRGALHTHILKMYCTHIVFFECKKMYIFSYIYLTTKCTIKWLHLFSRIFW